MFLEKSKEPILKHVGGPEREDSQLQERKDAAKGTEGGMSHEKVRAAAEDTHLRCHSTQNTGIQAPWKLLDCTLSIPWEWAQPMLGTERIYVNNSPCELRSFTRLEKQPFWDLPLSYYLNRSQKCSL